MVLFPPNKSRSRSSGAIKNFFSFIVTLHVCVVGLRQRSIEILCFLLSRQCLKKSLVMLQEVTRHAAQVKICGARSPTSFSRPWSSSLAASTVRPKRVTPKANYSINQKGHLGCWTTSKDASRPSAAVPYFGRRKNQKR